jgi:hypothetical protein
VEELPSKIRRWYLSYYRRLKPKGKDYTGPLALGSRVHRALELHYSTNEPLPAVWSRLAAHDRTLMLDEGRDLFDFDNEAELGRIMLEGYLEWMAETGLDSDVDIVSSEERLLTPMLNGRVELTAKVDQRVRRKSDGVRLFRDFKTSANFNDITATADLNEQLLTYLLIEALQKDEPERCDGGIFVMLRKVKRTASARPPFYDYVEVRHNIFTLRNFWTRVNGELQDIVHARDQLDAGADHHYVAYPRPSRDCTWVCAFRAQCPMFDDGSAVEQSLYDNFEVGDPYSYYSDKVGE